MQPHRGAVILVLGILGLVFCALCAPFAWIMGKNDLEQMNAGGMDPAGRGLTQAGMYLGLAGTILIGIGLLLVVGLFILGLVGASVQG